MLDNNVEELPEDDEDVVAGLRTEEVGGLERFLGTAIGKCMKPMSVKRLSAP